MQDVACLWEQRGIPATCRVLLHIKGLLWCGKGVQRYGSAENRRIFENAAKRKKYDPGTICRNYGVSNRSVSRWETGTNLPDLDILIQLADYYGVELREILDGERSVQSTDREMEETVRKVADYSNREKMLFTKRTHYLFIAGVIAFGIYMILDIRGLTEAVVCEEIASAALGLVLGTLLIGVLFTSRYMAKIRAFKRRLLKRDL